MLGRSVRLHAAERCAAAEWGSAFRQLDPGREEYCYYRTVLVTIISVCKSVSRLTAPLQ